MSAETRIWTSRALGVLAAVCLLGSIVSGYTAHAFLNSDALTDRASASLGKEAVADEIGRRVTGELIAQDPDLVAVGPLLEGAVSSVVSGSAFRSIFDASVRDVHRTVIEGGHDTVTLTFADIGATARGALQAIDPKLAAQVPADTDATVLEFQVPAVVADAVRFRALPWILLAITLVAVAGALVLSPDRRRAIVVFGGAITICGVLSVVALSAVRAHVLTGIDAGGSRDAAAAIWESFFGDLRRELLLTGLAGAVVTAAASSLLRPFDLRVPLTAGWEALTRVPERRLWRSVRGVVLTVIGIAIVLNPESFLSLAAVSLGLFIAYAGVAELLRLMLPEAAESDRRARQGRRTLIAAGVGAAGILAAGAIFISIGGTSEKPAAIVTEGCNGSDDLCDMRLDRVAFPSTHNSMSGATYPGYLFAQQETGIAGQLQDGIRGFLIDAHYGVPTKGGTVKTDFSGISSEEKSKLEQEIGPEALAAASRIRDRIVNSPATGPRQIYFCHGFCEVGAVPIDDILGEFRDFLAANPDEELVLVVEDYVTPADIAEAAKRTGLSDYIYRGPAEAPWPTLGQMAKEGGRVLMLAENNAGGGEVPWYHPAYDGILQETPYSFSTPSQLTDPDQLKASCAENRGTPDSPLFLVNNWIDTTPAPRPSNAAKVNAYDALMTRTRRCQSLRGIAANLIAVDFFRQGDVLGVAKRLNEERVERKAEAAP